MNRVIIRAIGKAHEPWHPQAIHSYLSRLQNLGKAEVIELAEGHEGSAKPNPEKTRTKEAEALLKGIPPGSTVVALDQTGQNLTSEAFAEKFRSWSDGGQPVVFLIGGSWGLTEEIRKRANFTLSLGKQTLPHLLARIVLLEQLYRAETILAGKTYHK